MNWTTLSRSLKNVSFWRRENTVTQNDIPTELVVLSRVLFWVVVLSLPRPSVQLLLPAPCPPSIP